MGPDIWHIVLDQHCDVRGSFVKVFAHSVVNDSPVKKLLEDEAILKEEFYSISKKNVLRGMHFQLPPHDHLKMVYCPVGTVLDVMLDLRSGENYGKVYSTILDQNTPSILVIPRGIAHGFLSLQDESLMVYKTSTEYSQQHDCGIKWDTFNFKWPCDEPIISDRDNNHPEFHQFKTPF